MTQGKYEGTISSKAVYVPGCQREREKKLRKYIGNRHVALGRIGYTIVKRNIT